MGETREPGKSIRGRRWRPQRTSRTSTPRRNPNAGQSQGNSSHSPVISFLSFDHQIPTREPANPIPTAEYFDPGSRSHLRDAASHPSCPFFSFSAGDFRCNTRRTANGMERKGSPEDRASLLPDEKTGLVPFIKKGTEAKGGQ